MANIMSALSMLLTSNWPSGFWENIINAFFTVIKDYGWTIILFTVALKIVLLPVDFWQRKSTMVSAEKQKIIAPQLKAIQEKYSDNREILNQKTMELYKKENYNIMGSCFSMLATLGITIAVFFTLFAAMNNIAAYKIASQYTSLETSYDSAYTVEYDAQILNGKTEAEADTLAITAGQNAVLETYKDVKESFLWIKNIWRPDTNASVILSFSDYKKVAKISIPEGEDKDTYLAAYETKYNAVMNPLVTNEDGWNGYFVLVVLSGVITFLSQKFMIDMQNRQAKNKVKKETKEKIADIKDKKGVEVVDKKAEQKPQDIDPSTSSAKIMMFILPVFMVIFTWQYSAAFALYIITNSLISSVNTIGLSKLITVIDEHKAKKQKEITKAPYSR